MASARFPTNHIFGWRALPRNGRRPSHRVLHTPWRVPSCRHYLWRAQGLSSDGRSRNDGSLALMIPWTWRSRMRTGCQQCEVNPGCFSSRPLHPASLRTHVVWIWVHHPRRVAVPEAPSRRRGALTAASECGGTATKSWFTAENTLATTCECGTRECFCMCLYCRRISS